MCCPAWSPPGKEPLLQTWLPGCRRTRAALSLGSLGACCPLLPLQKPSWLCVMKEGPWRGPCAAGLCHSSVRQAACTSCVGTKGHLVCRNSSKVCTLQTPEYRKPPPCACPVPFGVVVSGGPKWLPWEMRLWKCILEWKLHLPWLTDGQREVWMCTATSSSPMCLNVSLLFPICLSRTSTQLSPASYLRKKSRNFSIRCMKPTGWCPTHRDASLPASVEPWPFFVRVQLSSGL